MKVITFEELKDKFIERINSISNKKILIENEINEVDIYIRNERITKPLGGGSFFSPSPMQISYGKHVFDINIPQTSRHYFSKAFLKNLYEEEEIKYEDKEHPWYKERVLAIKQAYEFVDYYIWLKKILLKPNTASKKDILKLNHAEKVLALHYLGLKFNTKVNTQENFAEIISRLIGMNYQNTREFIGLVQGGKNEVRTTKNLERVRKLFETFEFTDIANKIKEDIK